MPPLPAPATRTPPRTRKGLADHLEALGGLVDCLSPDPTHLFDQGLALLVDHLRVDRALICRATDLGIEVIWWATGSGRAPNLADQELAHAFCPQVLDAPGGSLVLRDAQREGSWAAPAAARRSGVRAYLGVSLSRTGPVVGVLSVDCARAKTFSRGEVAMVKGVAGLFGKVLEIEQLKHSLRLTQDTLDLTRAVMEDGLLEASGSRLPNLRFLDIWLQAGLFMARRRGESMALVRWGLPPHRAGLRALRKVAQGLRGEDLLVDMGRDEFLLLLPRTDQAGAGTLLGKLRQDLGGLPMGATVWNPGHPADRDDLVLAHALKRAQAGLDRSRRAAQRGSPEVVWDLLPAGNLALA